MNYQIVEYASHYNYLKDGTVRDKNCGIYVKLCSSRRSVEQWIVVL